jgi:transcriptional regulator with XRE-family HTH domain
LSPDPERSIGAYLSRQRELRGISLDELATLTRIPRRSLERLESGVFDRAPDGFVRGFVRTVASALGLDPDETVMRLLCEPAEDGDGRRGGPVAWASPAVRWAAIAVGLGLVAGVLAWLAASPPRAKPTPAESEGVVMRRDLVRELAREAAARPAPAEAAPEPAAAPAPTADPEAPTPGPAPAAAPEPAGPAATARESAESGPEPGAPTLGAAPSAAAPPADIP